MQKFLNSARKSRAFRELKALYFTLLPIPIALVDRQLVLGDKIHERQAIKWSHVGHYDWRAYVEQDNYSANLVGKIAEIAQPDESVLDICCNVGRNLNALAELGYRNLLGIDIMEEAILKAPQIFPSLSSAQLSVGNCVRYIQAKPPNSVDWAITQSATVELIHPSFRIHKELQRIVRKGLVLVLNERGHSYPRYWRLLLKRSGFTEISRTQLSDGLTLLVFVTKSR